MKCPKCSRRVDSASRWKTCDKCREQCKLYNRRKAGWDGVSEWVSHAARRRPAQTVSARLAIADVAQLKEMGPLSGMIREAVESYLGDLQEQGAA